MDKENLVYNHLRKAMKAGISVYYKTHKGKLVNVSKESAMVKLDGFDNILNVKHNEVFIYAKI